VQYDDRWPVSNIDRETDEIKDVAQGAAALAKRQGVPRIRLQPLNRESERNARGDQHGKGHERRRRRYRVTISSRNFLSSTSCHSGICCGV